MSQNEEMKRLLWKGKIVAIQLHCSLKQAEDKLPDYLIESLKRQGVHWDDLITITCEDGEHWHGCYVNHDSFEPGIKQDDGTWWFAGDIIDVNNDDITTPVLVFDKKRYIWMVECNDWKELGSKYSLEDVFHCSKNIGNIHDNPEILDSHAKTN